MSRRVTMIVALLLALTLNTSTLATCLADLAAGSQTQMACCKNGHDACPMHHGSGESAAQCCRHDTPQQQLNAAEHEMFRPPLAPLAPLFLSRVVASMSAAIDHARLTPRAARVTLSPTPPHLLATVLLI